ncbi:MAG: type I-C CRISPR-associated endonuclease Cas1 [Deltaproteobacteria bacterium]|nr:type I-C CRISPR-associated endonuclease Cas1 [Deltaproteobacteria bacterium]
MRQHHNVLYLTTAGAYVHKRDAAVEVVREGHEPVRIPRHHLQSIVCFGPMSVSPWLMHACAEEDIGLVFLTEEGRYLARVVGPQNGNVLLRRAQYRIADNVLETLELARTFVLGKVCNCRSHLRRAARDGAEPDRAKSFARAADHLTALLGSIRRAMELDELRGFEGAAAATYFGCFPALLRGEEAFGWTSRSSRPPMDGANAVLSFLYSVLAVDCGSAAQAAGLDPQVGFLHAEKPGRPALALDLMEEMRPVLADRVLFALVNRRQLQAKHVERQASGAVLLTAEGRRVVLTEYQERKREEIVHPFTQETTTYGILCHLQARLLARHLRGDLDAYPPFLLS